MTTPCVVLAGRPTDPEFDAVERALAGTGVPARRLPAAIGADDLPVPTVCWTRRPLGAALPGPAEVFARESWAALVRQCESTARYCVPGPRTGLLAQLGDARRCGVRVPRTVVGTDPARVRAALPGDRLVLKVLHRHFVELPGGHLYGVPAQVVGRDELAADRWPGWPVVLQEYVPHRSEQRVFYADGRLVAMAVGKPASHSPWTDPDAVSATEIEVEPAVERVVTRLARRWRLRYGAFDLLLTGDDVVFLEVNHDGDWRWYEAKAGTRSVTTAVVAMVRELHLRAGGGAASVDLLSLLVS